MTPDEIYRARRCFFDESAERWLDAWYKDPETGRYDKHAKDFDRLFAILPLKPGDRVLDVGCGTGVLIPFILERIKAAGKLIELDFSQQMIAHNRRFHEAQNIDFIVSDAEQAPLDEACCDVVICFSCFPHFHDKAMALGTLTRILKPQGTFVVAHFGSAEEINRHHESCRAVMHDHLPDETEVRALFQKAGLSIERFTDEAGFYCVLAAKKPQEDNHRIDEIHTAAERIPKIEG